MSGMGELHIEVMKDRFKRQYGLDVFVGPLQVAYREMPAASSKHFEVYTGTRDNSHVRCGIGMKVEPLEQGVNFEFLGVCSLIRVG